MLLYFITDQGKIISSYMKAALCFTRKPLVNAELRAWSLQCAFTSAWCQVSLFGAVHFVPLGGRRSCGPAQSRSGSHILHINVIFVFFYVIFCHIICMLCEHVSSLQVCLSWERDVSTVAPSFSLILVFVGDFCWGLSTEGVIQSTHFQRPPRHILRFTSCYKHTVWLQLTIFDMFPLRNL